MKSTISCSCVECGEAYNPKRKALGYDTCLVCGDAEAEKQANRKARCTAPAFNKGAYMYITNRSMAKEIGR